MDREHLTRLVEDPARVKRDDIADLKAMAERYPWFSAAHLLLAVGEHRQGDVLFDEQLRTSAAHLPSRAVLFDLVHPLEQPPAPVVRLAPEVVADPSPPPTPVVEIATPPPVAIHAEKIEEVLQAPAAEEPLTPATEDPDPLDAQMRQAALASTYELLLGDTLPLPAPASSDRVPPRSDPAVPSRMSFSAWLDSTSSAPSRSDRASDPRRAAPTKDASELAAVEELIDRFIQQATPPTPTKKAEFFSPQSAAKRSLEDHADMVTETLARIYEKQGNISKARAAYMRLAEKHPDQREHFLALSRALDQR